jgi:hypothetical protein
VRATIEAWREQQADRVDPLRFHFIDALERRTASQGGEARRMLDERLSGLLQAYARDVADTMGVVAVDDPSAPSLPAPGPLGELVARMATDKATQGGAPLAAEAPSFPELPALDAFRKTWAGVRSGSQLRQSLQHVPANAGPLNSNALVHRSMALMRELSPGYLQRFLSYVDDLSWMERMNSGDAAARDAGRSVRPKRTRNKPHG